MKTTNMCLFIINNNVKHEIIHYQLHRDCGSGKPLREKKKNQYNIIGYLHTNIGKLS